MAKSNNLEDLLAAVAAGTALPVYLVHGDLVVAEPQARRLAEALAARADCPVESHHRPATLGPILADLKNYSLFAAAKVVLAIDTAFLADTSDAAETLVLVELRTPA